jgi:hypothetical protein
MVLIYAAMPHKTHPAFVLGEAKNSCEAAYLKLGVGHV